MLLYVPKKQMVFQKSNPFYQNNFIPYEMKLNRKQIW